jgi:hypothetical protein
VSLFGTVLHVRGRQREGVGAPLVDVVRRALEGLVPAESVTSIRPSLEDVFVLHGDEEAA